MGIIITKLANGNVEITGGNQSYTLSPAMHSFRDKSISIDGAKVLSDGTAVDVYRASNVDKVVRQDGTEILNPTGDELYFECKENLFYIVGGGSVIPPFLESLDFSLTDWSQLTETGVVYTANELISVVGNTITFSDLTGITIAETIGTGTFIVNGNNIECTVNGSLQKLTLSNGSVYLITEGVGLSVRDSVNDLHGTITGMTWNLGVDTPIAAGTQTSLISYSNYPYFDGVTNMVQLSNGFDLTGKVVEFTFVVSLEISYVYVNNLIAITQGCAVFCHSNGRVGATMSTGTGRDDHYINTLNNGDIATVRIEVNNYTDAVVTVNGIATTIAATLISATDNTETIGNRRNASINTPFTGVVIGGTIDGVERNPFNNWGAGAVEVGTFAKYISPEAASGFDTLGQEIQSPLLENGFNFTGQNLHHVDLTAITPNNAEWLPVGTPVAGRMTRDAVGDTDVYCFKVAWNGAQPVLSDGKLISDENSSNRLQNNRNGQVITSVNTVDLDQWYFILDTQQSGARQLYIGTNTVAPTEVGTAGGFMNAATQGMILGNSAAAAIDSLNGELVSYLHYTKQMSAADVFEIYESVKTLMK